jgi:CheY-like chemotaxis protein
MGQWHWTEADMGAGKKMILIIDDDPDTVTYLSTWLEDQGYLTSTAADGRQGMEALLREPPDLVLMDLKMPNQSGIHLYKEIKGHETLKLVPVIVITGMVEFELFDNHCVPLPEPVARIDKPPNLEALHTAIKQALS